MEKRLLNLLDQTFPEQTDRRQRLNETLADIRQSRANFILRLGPNHPVTPPNNTVSSVPLSPVP